LLERKAKKMENQDRIELLISATEDLNSAISKIEEALKGTRHYAHARAYILPHLQGWLTNEGYNQGIDGYITDLEFDEETEEQD
jgi:hypothetical protein